MKNLFLIMLMLILPGLVLAQTNLASGKTVTADPDPGTANGALDNLTDGAISTGNSDRWVSNNGGIGTGQYIFVDLESAVSVAGYLFYHQSFNALSSYEVAYRDVNTSEYVVMHAAPGSAGVSTAVNNVLLSSFFLGSNITTDMIRFELLDAGDTKARLIEIEIYDQSFLPEPPTNFSYTADLSTVSSPKVDLSWDDSPDEDEYKLTVVGATKPDMEITIAQDETSYSLDIDYSINFIITLEAVNTEGSSSADPIELNIAHPDNVALGKPAVASSESNGTRTADKAVDGDRNSNPNIRWQTENASAAHYLEIELGGNHDITGYRFGVLGNLPTDWEFQYWDGATWQAAHQAISEAASSEIIDDQENGNDIYVYEYSFSSQSTTDVRLIFDSSTPELKVYEVEVFGTFNPKTWNGTAWTPSAPSSNDGVIIEGEYVTGDDGNLSNVGSIEITETGSLLISSGTFVQNNSFITNSGTATIESGGSLLAGNTISGEAWTIHRNTPHSNGKYSIVGTPIWSAQSTIGDFGSLVYSYDETQPFDAGGSDGLDRFILEDVPTEQADRMVGYFSAFTGAMTFSGTPNRGDMTKEVTYTDHDPTNSTTENDYEGFYLLANPYPSAIDPVEFVASNSNYSGSLYFWDDNGSNMGRGTSSDYIVWSGMGSVGTTPAGSGASWDELIRSGQGFFVKVDEAATAAQFTDAMRVTRNNSDGYFFRKTDDRQLVRLSLSSDVGYSEMLIGFKEDATFGVDRLYDAVRLGTTEVQIYSLIEEDRYAIQGLPVLKSDQVIPLGFNVSQDGSYSLALNELINLASEYNVLLEDTHTGGLVDLSSGEYTFETKAGEFGSRFSLILTTDELLGADQELNGLSLKLNKSGFDVKVTKPSNIAVTVSSLEGKVLLQESLQVIRENHISFQFVADQVYLIRMATNGKSIIQKVLFK